MGEANSMSNIIYRNHSLKFSTPIFFYKVAFNKIGINILKKEVENYKLVALQPGINKLTIYPTFINTPLIYAIKLEKLKKITSNADMVLMDVLRIFENASQKAPLNLLIEGFFEKFISKQIDQKILKIIKIIFKQNHNLLINIGPSHGDLHAENIMLNNKDEVKFVDLDLYSNVRDNLFDVINIPISRFIISKHCKWGEAFRMVWDDEQNIESLWPAWKKTEYKIKVLHFLLYALERGENELKYGSPVPIPKDVIFWILETSKPLITEASF